MSGDQQPEKAIDDVYEDRNLLAAALAAQSGATAGWKPDPESPEEWAIVTIAPSGVGQMGWHVPRDLVEDLGLDRVNIEYDGHDREQKNRRLKRWARDYSNSRSSSSTQ